MVPDFLDNTFCLLGVFVLIVITVQRMHGLRPFRFPEIPEAFSRDVSGEKLLVVILIFFVSFQLGYWALSDSWFKVTSDESINDLSLRMTSDFLAKLITGAVLFGMVYPLEEGRFFQDVLNRFGKAVLIYIAQYPIVNAGMVYVGIFLCQYVLRLPVTEGHQTFELLNSSSVPKWIKAESLFLAAILSPVVEELFFRGILQNCFLKFRMCPAPAILLTATCFSAVHAVYHQIPALLVLGIVLGWSYYRFRSIMVPIFLHIVFNSMTLLFWFVS
jgi:membrane protease YdiL (CAAX protease family)